MIIGLALLVLLIVGVSHFVPRCHHRTVFLKHMFRRVDLVGEGELWIGGLVSIAILVLVSFAFYFSSLYANLYPTEASGTVQFACDPDMRNAKLSTNLQLLSTPKSEDEEPLFRLLEEQQFIMNIDFVQTLFDCDQVSVQQNSGTNHILLDIATCERHVNNATLSVSILVPEHLTTVQFNLTCVSSVGGARLCLFGSSASSSDALSTLKTLTFCQFSLLPIRRSLKTRAHSHRQSHYKSINERSHYIQWTLATDAHRSNSVRRLVLREAGRTSALTIGTDQSDRAIERDTLLREEYPGSDCSPNGNHL